MLKSGLLVCQVVSKKAEKTVIVAVEQLVTHRIYGKRMRQTHRIQARPHTTMAHLIPHVTQLHHAVAAHETVSSRVHDHLPPRLAQTGLTVWVNLYKSHISACPAYD